MNIKVSTGFSKERVENFYKFHMTRIDKMRHLFYVGVIGLLIIAVIPLLILNKKPSAIIVTIIAFIADVILITTRPYRLSRAFKKILKDSPMSEKAYHIFIKDEGINYMTDTTNEYFKWDSIVRVVEIFDAYYIYVSDNKAIILPKHAVDYKERQKFDDFVINLGIHKKYNY